MKIRLQKHLAESGLGSRRSCEQLIKAGRVTVDGRIGTLGQSVDPEAEQIAVDGTPVVAEPKEYWLLNKPQGVLSAVVDDRGRRTVVDCVPTRARVYPIGRLDLDTTGLLVLTNDGLLAERLLHPRYHVPKEYLVTLASPVGKREIEALERGVLLDEGITSPAAVRRVSPVSGIEAGPTQLRITIHEGRNRQVRRMLEAVGHKVQALHRSRFADIADDTLAVGQARLLTEDELAALRRLANLA